MSIPPVPPKWYQRVFQLIYLGDGWVRVFGAPPDVWPEITQARALVAFNGLLYAGTRHLYGLQIWRTNGSASWYRCVGKNAKTPAGFGDMSNGSVHQMVVLDGTLYAGTDRGIWLTQDGDNWQQVSTPGMKDIGIDALAAFGNYIYAANGTWIFRGVGTTGWTLVVGDKPGVKTKAGFGDADITDITSLEVFDSKLYAGAGMDNPTGNTGIQVWRTSDGINWQLLKKETSIPGSLHIHAMQAFGNHLYIGGYHSLKVYRTDGSQGSWQDVTDGINTGGGNDGVWSWGVYKGKLHLGATGAAQGKILWSSSDGKTWQLVNPSALGKDKVAADALQEYKGYLYLTTYHTYTGPKYPGEHKMEIWRYGPIYAPQYWLINFVKPLLARIPRFHFPPPPVWLSTINERMGQVVMRIRDRFRRG